ncbi:MAG: hypothetical protein FJ009_20625, partial [Chloroflexi bacterium]|nr:hypothetical protein [Chloroflexota bacterium]
ILMPARLRIRSITLTWIDLRMHPQRFFSIALFALGLALAACATSEVRDQRSEVSTLTPTASLAPPVTLPPTAAPTFTATPPPTATATPTRTAAQARAASLAPLAGFTWRADGDIITLTDAKGARVATLDEKAGGVLRVDSDGAAAFTALDAVSKQKFLQANSENVRIIQTSFHTDAKNQPQAAVVEWLTKDGLKKVAIPSPANVTWDEKGKRMVVGLHGEVYSHINPQTGEKDITPSFPKILVETPQDEKLVREALANVAPYILDLPNFVDNFYSYPRAAEFKKLIETNYPGVKFDDLLQAIKTTAVKKQEQSLAILAIANPDKLRREFPEQSKISDNVTQFYWNGSLGNSSINMPLKWMRDPSELHGGFLKEYFSLIAGEAIKTNSKLYQTSIAGRINGVTYFTYVAGRFGAYAFVQDFSGMPQITAEFINRLVTYSFKPDSEMIFR